MKYGCIGEVLKHSFSREIHTSLSDNPYELCEVAPDELDEFMRAACFSAINVTIPYKELVIPYLDEIDEPASLIGAVNTVVNRNGRLYGYNTDFYGMLSLLEHAGVNVMGKKVLILGSGGTAKTARAVVSHLGADKIITVGRQSRDGVINYEEAYALHCDAEVIINTTPVGMYPNAEGCPIDISRFDNLSGVIDAIYNPLNTRLILSAKERGICAEGGLYMLVAQAVRASEIFLNIEYPAGTVERIFKKVLKSKENIVLIGMPSCGKSTVGRLLSNRLCRELLDTDILVEEEEKCDIPTIFKKCGEEYFREVEARIVNNCSQLNGRIIATGGGVVLNPENIRRLHSNGRIYFIDRPLSELLPTTDRPLASNRDAIEKRYMERYELYLNSSDIRIVADEDAFSVADRIIGDFCDEDICN